MIYSRLYQYCIGLYQILYELYNQIELDGYSTWEALDLIFACFSLIHTSKEISTSIFCHYPPGNGNLWISFNQFCPLIHDRTKNKMPTSKWQTEKQREIGLRPLYPFFAHLYYWNSVSCSEDHAADGVSVRVCVWSCICQKSNCKFDYKHSKDS